MCGCLNSGRNYNSNHEKGVISNNVAIDCEITYANLLELDRLVLFFLREDKTNKVLLSYNQTISKWRKNYKVECVPVSEFLFIKNHIKNEFSND